MSFHLITLGFLLRGQLAEFCPAFHKTGGIEHFTGYSFHFLIYPFLADTTSRYICLAYCLKYCCKWDFFLDLFGAVINLDILACSNSVHKLVKNMCKCNKVRASSDVLVYFLNISPFLFFFFFQFLPVFDCSDSC